MRKWIVTLCLLVVVSAAQAIPVYITITGQVTFAKFGDKVDDFGVKEGDIIEQVWMYDLDVQGIDGNKVYDPFYPGGSNPALQEYGAFFVDRISGGVLDPFNQGPDTKDFGWSSKHSFAPYVSFTTGSDSGSPGSGVKFDWGTTISNLFVGQEFTLEENHKLLGSNYHYSKSVNVAGTITAISTVNPLATVPEPSTVWLLLPGLLGLAFTRYIRHPES